MAHTPVNHPLRPIYRALGALTGVYFIVFGIVGIIVNAGEGLFGNDGGLVLGQRANMFWSIVALLVGAIVLAAAVLGRNSDTVVDKYFGWGLVGVGAYELAVLRTDANFLDWSVATVVVTWLLALVLIMAGQYSKVAPPSRAGAPRQEREAQNA
ncbi:DUF4383 domain-containing protein [Nucisporomicrobium flavum]|uniref:DUF4383 domain-containing protein n=1 Tax=Nucisporomicrobium flavum TaxID=2785915 RepID=UPI0018F7CA66|nr:DUF4383 domain-containing protein [Nucisporomicrobium flavum]